MKEKGIFYNYEDLKQTYNLNINILDFYSLREAVNKFLQKYDCEQFQDVIYPVISDSCKLLIRSNKGSKDFYNLMIKKHQVEPISHRKWESIYDIGSQEWEKIHELPFKTCIDTKLRWFQYRIVNRILATKSFLYKINLVNSPLCNFCNNDIETIEHVFVQCPRSKVFFQELKVYIQEKTEMLVHFSDKDILFGFLNTNDKLYNTIMLLAKRFIYISRLKNHPLTFELFIPYIKNLYLVEKYIFFNNCDYAIFFKRWKDWMNIV